MAAERFYGDDATLTITDNNGTTPTEIPVASLKGVTFTLAAEHVQLFSADTIERESVHKRQLEIPVEISVAAFDVALIKAWMSGDETNTTATSVTDTSDVAEFEVKGTFTTIGGGTTYNVTIEDVFFPEMPMFDMSEGEYITEDLSGTGRTVSNFA